MLNLATVLDYSSKENPEKTALICGDKKFSFAQLDAFARKIADGLVRAGIEKGDKVALSCPNLPFFPMVYYGILKAGATVVPLNVLLKAREIAYHLEDSEARAYFCFEGVPGLPMAEEGFKAFQLTDRCEHFWVMTADPAAPSPIAGAATLGGLLATAGSDFETVQTSPDDTAVILYTSGTTGFPKGAELSHSSMVMNAVCSRDLLRLDYDDSMIITLPLFHSFGQTVQMNAGLMHQNTLILIPRFSPEAVFAAIQEEGGTVFAGVPTMYWELLNFEDREKRFDFDRISRTLRKGVSGGASLPVEIINGIEEKYNIPIFEGYGLSETCPVATFNQPHKPRKPGSIGFPIWGIEVKVVNEKSEEVPVGEIGEIAIRGHNIMKGYYNKPDATAAAFKGTSWFHSGDLGRMDEDGYFYIVDRVKDMIIRGGYNIYPREIEEVLLTHPAISLVAVIGVPDEQYGEEIKAYVILKEGQEASAGEIIAWCKEQMASYKYPRIVEIRETLPMTATGKILKKELKKEVTG